MNSNVIDIFYNEIVPEAKKGEIDCYLIMHTPFNLVINNERVSQCESLPCEGLLVPDLKITDKEKFESLLCEYVNKAIGFYDSNEFIFLKDVQDQTEKINYQIKYIICTLFANASFSDFEHPIEFLKGRIAMIENPLLEDGYLDFGYLESINARLQVKEEISPIRAESPYCLRATLSFEDGYILNLPEIYGGNAGKEYILYGIQKTTESNELEERPYLKQIRKGLIAKINGAPEHYFLAVMLFLSLCSDKQIKVVPFLVQRWNAKKVNMHYKVTKKQELTSSQAEEIQDRIQSNITDIFLRYLTKLEDVTPGIEFFSLPYDVDSNLHLNIHDDLQSRSIVFNEIYSKADEYRKARNNITR